MLTYRAFSAASGILRRVVVSAITRRIHALTAVLMFGLCSLAIADETKTPAPPSLLTNLIELRHNADQSTLVMHPFRITAEVLDVDSSCGALVLRDSSDTEFIQLDLGRQKVEPGERVCLEGKGYGVKVKGFGLALVPELTVNNDGYHSMVGQSGSLFLHAGPNPITIRWFNFLGSFGLNVEYEGPGLPRQTIPSSVLSRAFTEPATGTTNFSAGVDYRCFEGAWVYMPDFSTMQPVKTGITTNFDLGVRTRDENVGLEFSGFIAIARDGLYTFHLTSDDGSLLFLGESSLNVRVLGRGPTPYAAGIAPAAVLLTNDHSWVTLEGTVHFAGIRGTGGELEMRAENNDIRVEVFEDGELPKIPLESKVRVSGIYQNVVAEDGSRVPGMLLIASWKAVRPAPRSGNDLTLAFNELATNLQMSEPTQAKNTRPALVTAAEIKALPVELAKRQLPVSIRGVATAILPSFLQGAVIQDSTKGISIGLQDLKVPTTIKFGELYQVDGVTSPGLFAPVIFAHRITHLGSGHLPQPLHVTWDQLMNGSLDTQYAEIEGIVLAVHNQQIVMLTGGGNITLDLSDFQSQELAGCEDALVRVRGCVFATFNLQTHELETGLLRVYGGALEILKPPPRNVFDVPQKRIGELLLYDPRADPLRLLRVSGQVIFGQPGEYFLTDGTNGMHVTLRSPAPFAVGDLVDAVGFLEVGKPATELKEAVMRKTGRAPLPPPIKLTAEHLLESGYAGNLVQVDATLMNQWRERSEHVLELESGFVALRARLNSFGQPISLPPTGSRLELTGVYAPQGARSDGGNPNGFDLLLSSVADVRILSTPSWWNFKRVIVLTGILAALLCAVSIWNRELHRLVQERTRKLEVETRNRRQAELRHAAEAERARIARDLHDELGTGLTEVSLLASTGAGEFQGDDKSDDRLRVVGEKARALVSSLDVIVWAIDPKRNSLQSFADYLGRYATELFSRSQIICRFQIPIECEAVTLTETARHGLFLAVKEAFNNVIRHSAATEVELRISKSGDRLRVVISDNGRGFDWNNIRRGNGLRNLQERLEGLNGECHIDSQVGRGTVVEFIVPLPHDPVKLAQQSPEIS